MWKAIITGLILGSPPVHLSALADLRLIMEHIHSIGCMLLRECEDGVYKISSMDGKGSILSSIMIILQKK